jgi:hypothetical protein
MLCAILNRWSSPRVGILIVGSSGDLNKKQAISERWEVVMRCRSCGVGSGAQTFNGEVALHFPGLDGLTKPIVWAFPKVLVWLDCGFAEFALRDEQVKTLRNSESSDLAIGSAAA